MAENKRSLFEVHFHSHGDLQFGPRTMGGETEEPTTQEESTGSGVSVGALALMMLGAAVAVALARRRRRGAPEPTPPEQKNLDRWIPTR